MSFLLLSTLICLDSASCLKVGGWWLGLVGCLQDFSVSPRPLGTLNLLGGLGTKVSIFTEILADLQIETKSTNRGCCIVSPRPSWLV